MRNEDICHLSTFIWRNMKHMPLDLIVDEYEAN
jgi:hypothetical protein